MPELSALARVLERRLARAADPRACVIAITGAVAVGKSTLARALRRALLRRLRAPVEVVCSDGFLISDDELTRAGALDRKGHPESYRHAELAAFFAALAAGARDIAVPIYSHRERGVVGEQRMAVPRALIFEGVYAVQSARASGLDCVSLFLDASEDAVERAYLERFVRLHGARFAGADEACSYGRRVYERVNRPNFAAHIAPLRAQADHVLVRDASGAWRVATPRHRRR